LLQVAPVAGGALELKLELWRADQFRAEIAKLVIHPEA